MKDKATRQFINLNPGIYAIAGISKNSGKTSLLNDLLLHNSGKRAGVLTTGRDGEEKDVLFGNPKPAVKLPENTLFTTTADSIDKLGTAIEVLDKLPYSAGNKQLWLLKTIRAVETEIAGPGSSSDQVAIARKMQQLDTEIVLIDGSLDRKSVALHPMVKGVFIVVGSSYGSLEKIISELNRLVQLASIPRYNDKNLKEKEDSRAFYSLGIWQRMRFDTLMGNETAILNRFAETGAERFYLPGVLTDSIFNDVKPALKNLTEIIVRHPLQIHLNKTNLENLLLNQRVYCLRLFVIKAIAVNSWSVSGSHLDSQVMRNRLREEFHPIPVLDIKEESVRKQR
jgi:hypothetical protein